MSYKILFFIAVFGVFEQISQKNYVLKNFNKYAFSVLIKKFCMVVRVSDGLAAKRFLLQTTLWCIFHPL